MTVAVVGSGFGGIGMAIHLKRAGIPFVVYEKAASLGGTWRDNTYPGAGCDIPADLYAFSFATRSDWPRTFASQPEILAYLRAVARAFDLERHVRYGQEIVRAAFDDTRGDWRLTSATGEHHRAEVLVTACGLLNRPSIPRIPGLDTFAGSHFHSARWPKDADVSRSVAVVGTGASAVQIVPEVARHARRVYVFQRTAPYVIPKSNPPQQRRTSRFRRARRDAAYLRSEVRALAFVEVPAALSVSEAAFRLRLRRRVANAELRAALDPPYRMGCKRILLSSEYYQALARENVSLVTTPIERFTERGVVTSDGAERPVDTVVFATGFEATNFLAPMEVAGHDGRDLRETWRLGAEAYLGISVAGFPNLFILYGPNTNLAHNSIVYMLESQIRYVMRALAAMRRLRLRSVDVLPSAQRRFVGNVQRAMARTIWERGCESWYMTAAGRVTVNWPGFSFAYRRATRRFEPSAYRLDSRAE